MSGNTLARADDDQATAPLWGFLNAESKHALLMEFNSDPEWLREKAEKEDGCFVSVGLQELPDDVEVFRASGESVCDACGRKLCDHPRYNYPGFDYGPAEGCDGRFYHL